MYENMDNYYIELSLDLLYYNEIKDIKNVKTIRYQLNGKYYSGQMESIEFINSRYIIRINNLELNNDLMSNWPVIVDIGNKEIEYLRISKDYKYEKNNNNLTVYKFSKNGELKIESTILDEDDNYFYIDYNQNLYNNYLKLK